MTSSSIINVYLNPNQNLNKFIWQKYSLKELLPHWSYFWECQCSCGPSPCGSSGPPPLTGYTGSSLDPGWEQFESVLNKFFPSLPIIGVTKVSMTVVLITFLFKKTFHQKPCIKQINFKLSIIKIKNYSARDPWNLHYLKCGLSGVIMCSFSSNKTLPSFTIINKSCFLLLTANKFIMVCPVSRYTDSRKRILISVVGYAEKQKHM